MNSGLFPHFSSEIHILIISRSFFAKKNARRIFEWVVSLVQYAPNIFTIVRVVMEFVTQGKEVLQNGGCTPH